MQLDILFLDIDGVLNPDKAKGSASFAPDCAAQLKRFLEAHPEVKIVFSTTWRNGLPLFALGWLWHLHGLPIKAVIGRTPSIEPARRGEEIKQWLADAPVLNTGCQIRRYAVLDDELDPLLGWIPRRTVFWCDPYDGLTPEITNQLIRYFSL